MTRRLLVLLAGGLIALAGCGGGGAGGAGGGAPAVAQTDVNPRPRDNVRDGGTLRLPMDIFPANFNYNQVDGTTSDVLNIVSELMPYWFSGTADGGLRLNTDYATSAELTSTNPQVVTYTINPKANWSDGSPITWRDFEAYWRSSNGTNPAYQTSGTTGYSDIATVARGVDDRQVVLTFSKPFAEWKTLFNPFYPAAATTSPRAFDNFCRTRLPLTAGPFALGSIDATAKTISVNRDPKWWGTPAKLDSIIYRQYDPAALPDALANNEIDYYEIGSDLNLLRRAQGTRQRGGTPEIYGSPQGNVVRENYGRIGTPEIDALYTKGVAELDDAKRADIGNQIDRLLWQQVHSVVLYARAGAVAVRSTLANFGASGLADTDYIDAGFMQ